jgi:hypothetical protein
MRGCFENCSYIDDEELTIPHRKYGFGKGGSSDCVLKRRMLV